MKTHNSTILVTWIKHAIIMGAKYFTPEINYRGSYAKYCLQGNVVLPPLQSLPDVLQALYASKFPWFYAQHSKILYCLSILPPYGTHLQDVNPCYTAKREDALHIDDVNVNPQNVKYGPIYFLETEEAINRRNQNHDQVGPNIIQLLERVLR